MRTRGVALWLAGVAVFTAASAGAATIQVTAGGSLQAAINAAQPGDVILLQPGATYAGNFVLPNKGETTAFITIRTGGSGAGLPPAGTRIGPAASGSLAIIRSPNTMSALSTAAGAHHWRLELLEFAANVRGYGEIIALGSGGAAQSTLAAVPHHLVLDRLLVRGDPVIGQKRGIGLNSASTTITNSYVADCKGVGFDTQAIAGWNGPGPYTITNNYLEASGENVMFGGASPVVPGLVPADVTLTRNDIVKPLAWKRPILSAPSGLAAAAGVGALPARTYYYFVVAGLRTAQDSWAWSARSAEVAVGVGEGGSVTVSWTGDPKARIYRVYRGTAPGAADRFFDSAGTVFTDSGGAPSGVDTGAWIRPVTWSVKALFELKAAERVLVDGNRFENTWKESQTGYAVVFTPRNQDNTSPWVVVRDVTFSNNVVRNAGAGIQLLGYDDIAPASSQRTSRIRVVNNVFAGLGSADFPGPGHWLLVNSGPADVRVEHNTVIQAGNMIYACAEPAANFAFANNLVRYGTYGIMGDNRAPGNDTIGAYLPGSTITANGIGCGASSSACRASSYPAGNLFLAESEWQAQFVNFAAGDYRLAAGSRFVNAGTDGKSLGADLASIDAARGVTSPPSLASPVNPPKGVRILIQ